MRRAFIAFIAATLALACGCALTKQAKAPGTQKGETQALPENVRIYNADYDTTFRAALDALRQIEDFDTKFAKYSAGMIIFKEANHTSSITVNVTKDGEKTTRVAFAVENRQKGRADDEKETRDAFFEEMGKLLDGSVADKITADGEEVDEAVGEEPPAQETPKKGPIKRKIKQALQLNEDEISLDALSYEELVLLDQRLEALAAVSREKEKIGRRCAACYIDLARFYHGDKLYDRSAEALKIAIAMDPDSAVAHCNLGEIYKHLGRYDEAIQELQKAQRLDPELPDIFINLGIIYDDYIVDDKKALENYRKYLELGGDNKQVSKWIAEIKKGL